MKYGSGPAGLSWGLVLTAAFLVPAAGMQMPFYRITDESGTISYFIASGGEGYQPNYGTLAQWAMAAWQEAAGGSIQFVPAADEQSARLRLYWAGSQGGRYGEMLPILVRGKPGAMLFIQTEVQGLGREIEALAQKDPLFRDTIIHLTCLHELGHALGLGHTDNYQDIMFFFGYGGDIPNYFRRYRNKLERPEDIRKHSGLSARDVERLRRLYPKAKAGDQR